MFKHTTRATLLLLFAGTLISSVLTHDINEPWKCVHDQIEHAEPSLLDMEETGFNEAREGRLLTSTSYPNIRMYAYYGLLSSASSSFSSYLQEELIPPILSYFEGALTVKYPVSGTFKVTSGSVCGENTPSVLKTGISADYVYFIKSEDDSAGSWVASSTACSLASGSHRPLVGMTTVNNALLKATTDVLLHEKNMICLLHEMTHTLGFSNTLFGHFIDSSGKTISDPILSGSLDGASCQIINVSPLTEKLQSYFGCSSLKGAYMENSGDDATAGSHFERRQYAFEAMTSGLIYEMQYSQFTLAMLESSGWYVPNYDYADPFFFGQGQGCNFLTEKCTASGFSFEEFCTGSDKGCTNPGRGGGSCETDLKSDNCRFVHPNVNLDCGGSGSYARLPNAEAYGRGLGSKCFTGTLASSSRAESTASFCFKYSCSGSGSDTILNVEVGSKTVECTSAGSKTVSGYAGTITCPDPVTFCSTVGQKVCPRGCMGRGTCENGACSCYSGFKGEDCALSA